MFLKRSLTHNENTLLSRGPPTQWIQTYPSKSPGSPLQKRLKMKQNKTTEGWLKLTTAPWLTTKLQYNIVVYDVTALSKWGWGKGKSQDRLGPQGVKLLACTCDLFIEKRYCKTYNDTTYEMFDVIVAFHNRDIHSPLVSSSLTDRNLKLDLKDVKIWLNHWETFLTETK